MKKNIREIDDIEQPLRIYVQSRGWLYEKLDSNSRRAWPDRTLIRDGKVVFCELKRPGEEPTQQQYKRHAEIRAKGGTVVWFNDLAKAKEYFK